MKLKGFLLAILALLCIGLASCDEDAIPEKNSESGHTHSYNSTYVAPTCTERGYTLKECECGESGKYDYVDALGHKEGEWKTVSVVSCKSEGRRELYCLTCKEIIESVVEPQLDHSCSRFTVAPTCTEQGYTKNTCKNCGHSYNDTFMPTINHEPSDPIITVNPTCKKTGEREYHCKWCDTFINKQTISVIECNYVAHPVEASGENEAYTSYTCSSCGDSYTGPYISPEELSQITAKEIYEKVKNALVEIICYDKKGNRIALGSGFFISSDGYIATNYHVVRGAYQLSIIKYAGGTTVTSVKAVAYDSAQDVAILKIETQNEVYLEFTAGTPETGDNVYAIGSSYGLTDTFTCGMISNPNRYVNGKYCLQFTAPISSGNSGGPLLDSTGKVIGIVTLTVADAQNINFAIKASTVEGVNNQKLNTPLDISALYEKTLEQNAVHILKFHIMNNHTDYADGVYYIYSYDPQTSTSLGREYYYVYDSEEDLLYLQIDIIASKTGMNRLTITVVLDEDNDGKFAVSMYDYSYAQETIKGTLNHTADLKVMTTYNEEYFNNVFNDVEIKYLETDTASPPQTMKILFYQSYSSLMAKFANMLLASGTQITAETLNIKLPSM